MGILHRIRILLLNRYCTWLDSSVDATPPTVTSTNPASGVTGFPIASSITATFSEAVQSATVTTSTYTLKNSAGTAISQDQ